MIVDVQIVGRGGGAAIVGADLRGEDPMRDVVSHAMQTRMFPRAVQVREPVRCPWYVRGVVDGVLATLAIGALLLFLGVVLL